MRRVLLWLVLTGIVAGTVWTFRQWMEPREAGADPWSAIPSGSAVILEMSGGADAWATFTGASQVWAAFSEGKEAVALDSLVSRTLRANAASAAGNAPLIAFVRRGEAVGWIAVIAGPADRSASPWPELFKTLGGSGSSSSTFPAQEIAQASPTSGLERLAVYWTKGLLLVASDDGMLEEGRLQLESSTGLMNDSTFVAAYGTLGTGADAHLMLHPARFSRSISNQLASASAQAMNWPEGWAALDIQSKPDALLLTGLLKTSASNGALTNMREQGTGHIGVLRVLPLGTVALECRHIGNVQQLMESGDQNPGNVHTTMDFSWMEGSVAYAVQRLDSLCSPMAVLQAGDPAAAERALFALCDTIACDTSQHRGVRLVKLPDGGLFGDLLGAPFDALNMQYWCMLGDKVVLAENTSTLHSGIDAWTDGTSLAEDPRASAFFSGLGNGSSLTYWCNLGLGRPWLTSHLNVAGLDTWNAHDASLTEFSDAVVQLSPGQHGFFHLDIRLKHGGAVVAAERAGSTSSNALWSMSLRSPIARDPDLMVDHTTGTRYIVAQDVEHRLTAVSSTGKVMWSRELDGPVIGAIRQVDRFKNGKLQLVFPTRGHVYMIDRNGKDVDGWPVEVKEKASGPAAVFDYEGTKDYRIVVPTEEGGIVNLMPDGKAVTGWSPSHLPSASAGPVRHLRVKNSDHLFLADHDGVVHLLDRKGAPKYRAKLKLSRGAKVLDVRIGMSIGTCSVIWVDSSGAVQSGTFDGEVKVIAAASEHASMGDVDGDGTMDVLLTKADSMVVLGGTAPLRLSMGCSPGEPKAVSLDRNTNGIAVACGDGSALQVFEKNGMSLPLVPVTGGRYFAVSDINKDGRSEIIVANASGGLSAMSIPMIAP